MVYLRGGPGSGCTPAVRRLFDPRQHLAVLFDQRSAGRSTPHASEAGLDWHSIDLDGHVGIERLRHLRTVEAYRRLLMDRDPSGHHAAAIAWCRWEDALAATAPDPPPSPRYEQPAFRHEFARQVTRCWANDHWLAPDELVSGAIRLSEVPGRLVHGRLDRSGPLAVPRRLHRAWPGSELIVGDEGHAGSSMTEQCRRLLADLADDLG